MPGGKVSPGLGETAGGHAWFHNCIKSILSTMGETAGRYQGSIVLPGSGRLRGGRPPHGEKDQFLAVGRARLGIDVSQVSLEGVGSYLQAALDAFVAQALQQEESYFFFPGC